MHCETLGLTISLCRLEYDKPIAAFSCTPRVQEVHTKAEVLHLTSALLGLGVLFNCHA